ncbi:hypothetical protein EV13_1516 [Prochlorococcus sp. MIT 0702]|nr:hypothetical protein EV13_1516 [Prochlorococcus sp. MIT 0702]KGG29191.1 hypothetical protein EV12_0242 [Prochlorococcus sp. MIT 0701]KGG34488.1 hypothetical protein EV14_1170 [Prochlorococcus sp. MIT 0703]
MSDNSQHTRRLFLSDQINSPDSPIDQSKDLDDFSFNSQLSSSWLN